MKLDSKIINLLKTIGFYVLLMGLTILLSWLLPGDMCNPGLGMVIIIFIVPILSISLLIRNIYLLSKGKREHVYSLIFHIIVVLTVFIVFNFK